MSRRPSAFTPMNGIMGLSGILLGTIAGYILGAGQPALGSAAAAPAAATAATADPHVHLVSDEEIKAYKDILAADPKNVKAATELANKLYDSSRFAEAIPYYQQALALDASNVSISTDLGTSLYYAGRTDDALKRFETSLKIDPTHAQTWFNIGIVKRDGKKDEKGAAAAWEQLLKINPNYPDGQTIRAFVNKVRNATP